MASTWLLLSIGVLSFCLQAHAQAVPPAETCTCTEEYSPTCAEGTLYSNPCMAQCKGFGPDSTYKPVDGACKKPCNACDLDYSPVCAHGKMYASVCHAACNGVPVNVTYAPEAGSCEFVPVPGCVTPVATALTPKACAISSDREVFQFGSQGEATCLGLDDTFPCADMSKCSACMPYDMPVCAKKAATDLVGTTFANPCLATCAGYPVLTPGACPCGCSTAYAPVCAVSAPEGKMDQYPNACMAQCAGVLQWKDGACSVVPEVCECPLDYNPVCGTSAVGTKATFPNVCSALCAASASTVPGVCPADSA